MAASTVERKVDDMPLLKRTIVTSTHDVLEFGSHLNSRSQGPRITGHPTGTGNLESLQEVSQGMPFTYEQLAVIWAVIACVHAWEKMCSVVHFWLYIRHLHFSPI